MTTVRFRFILLILVLLPPATAGADLHEAASRGDVAQVKKLLEAGADVNAESKLGRVHTNGLDNGIMHGWN